MTALVVALALSALVILGGYIGRRGEALRARPYRLENPPPSRVRLISRPYDWEHDPALGDQAPAEIA